ncbi:hypothetical protein [Streptomyces sp. NPDC091294]|uniref:hypothetical protein n=1 Tax=Streptomyces sp. NPDC091294 TaxID=3365992 RepID=UPI003830AFA3
MHPYAQATLVRAAFENAARAVWLLAPGKRLTRIQRRLALQADNNTHSDRMHDLLGATPIRTATERTRQIRDLAVRAGIPVSDVKKELTFGYKKMVRTAGERDVLGRVGNVALARLSTDSKILLWITTITVPMIEYGFRLYKERASCHSGT